MMQEAERETQDKSESKVRESAHKIWLAGLGAVAVAEEGGSRLFNHLVEKGEGLESRSRDRIDRVKEQAGTKWEEISSRFDTRVAAALERLGVPNQDELTRLREKIEELERKVEGLG